MMPKNKLLDSFHAKIFFAFIVCINITLMAARFIIRDAGSFSGNIFTVVVFVLIFLFLIFLLWSKRYDYFLLTWLSFYFASPIIKLPFTEIGSLGILNGILIPLMLLLIFDYKNKYFLSILILVMFSIFNMTAVPMRIMLSSLLQYSAPFIFFYFALKKSENIKLLVFGSILVACINLPISIYEIIFKPDWGVFIDWRGARIFGNLFHPNSYSMYLLPLILITYAYMREKFSISKMIVLISLLIVNIFTFSRIGLVSLLVSVFVFELLYKQGMKFSFKKMMLILLMSGVIMLIQLIPLFENNHLQIDTIRERTIIWESITPFLEGHLLLGNGLGSYEIYRSQVFNSFSTHNVYLKIIFEIGLLGLLVVCIFLYFMLLDFFKFQRQCKKNIVPSVGISLFFGIILFAFTDSAPFAQEVALNSWILLGCFIMYSKKVKRNATEI